MIPNAPADPVHFHLAVQVHAGHQIAEDASVPVAPANFGVLEFMLQFTYLVDCSFV